MQETTMFFNTKENITKHQKANVIYRIAWPGFFIKKCLVKTDRNLIFWLHELGSKVDQPIYQHLSNVSIFHKIAQNDGTWC